MVTSINLPLNHTTMPLNSHSLVLLALMACAFFLPADQTRANAPLREGDVVELRISGVPPDDVAMVSGAHTVDQDGNINLPYIGRVQAVGLTQSQLQASIENRYKAEQIYSNPTVIISQQGSSRFVNVGGDVRSPGRVAYTPDLTLMKAITASGDFTEFANPKQVRLLRDGESMTVDVRKIRENPSLDIALTPGDDVFVPRSWW